jgi:hypothetical protein
MSCPEKHVCFTSGVRKEDWWHGSEGTVEGAGSGRQTFKSEYDMNDDQEIEELACSDNVIG